MSWAPNYSGLYFLGNGKGVMVCNGQQVAEFCADCISFESTQIKMDGINIVESAWPVGSIYMTEHDSPSPEEVLMFGKWEIIIKEPVYYWKRVA